MTRVEEIEKEIEELPDDDFRKLKEWMSQKSFDQWDKKIESDSMTGKLDFLVTEAKDSNTFVFN